MLLWRLWLRPDRRFLVAALGIAAAILVPVAGTLVIQGLDVQIANDDWIAYRVDGQELPAGLDAELAVRFESENGVPVAAYVIGPPRVDIDESANGASGLRASNRALATPLVPAGTALVHPDTLSGDRPHVALFDGRPSIPGAIVAPARGPDAFEAAGVASLQAQTLVLVLASVPAVALVAMAFGDHEARQRARSAATLAALGRPSLGRRILMLRVLWLMAWAVAFATVVGFLLWRFGGPAFHPEDTRPLGLAAAIAVPAALGGGIGMLWAARRLGSGEERLRVPPADNDLPGRRLGWLPVLLRPVTLGTRILPLLLVAGLLFGVNLGFPIAAASVPAAIAGGSNEWVIGSDGGIAFGGSADARPAAVMALDPAIDAIVAERLLPTLLNGEPVLVRGGDLASLAAYHGVRGIDGPGLWLGQALAARLDLAPGDTVTIQGADPVVARLSVQGIYAGGGVLTDEALLDNTAAGALTGHAPGEATVLRMRPDSEEARAAIARPIAQIEVIDVRVQGTPRSTESFDVEIDVVNLAGAAGTRDLPVRINGLVQTVVKATLPAYGRATLSTSLVAPFGPFQIEVNPTVPVAPQSATVALQAPRLVFLPDAIAVTVDRDGPIELRSGSQVIDAAQVSNGQARLNASTPGRYQVVFDDASRRVIVSPSAYRDHPVLEVDALWTTPHQPAIGEVARLHIGVTNVGMGGEGSVNVTVAQGTIQAYTRLLSGQSGVIDVAFTRSINQTGLIVDGHTLSFDPSPGAVRSIPISAEKSGNVQAKVADRVLGDAQTAMVGLAAISLVSILSLVYLATERTLAGRAHIPRILHAIGMAPEQVRYRAAWEAALLAGSAFLASAGVAKLVFIALGAIGWPLPFAHALPDPIGWLFVVQAGTAFAGAAALAAYMAAGRIVGVAGAS